MAHAQKPDLVFQRKGRVHLNWRRGEGGGDQFSRLLAAEVCASAVVMLDTPCSEVECKTTRYPLHSHVSPSLPLSCVTVCHQVSTELYQEWLFYKHLSYNLQRTVEGKGVRRNRVFAIRSHRISANFVWFFLVSGAISPYRPV